MFRVLKNLVLASILVGCSIAGDTDLQDRVSLDYCNDPRGSENWELWLDMMESGIPSVSRHNRLSELCVEINEHTLRIPVPILSHYYYDATADRIVCLSKEVASDDHLVILRTDGSLELSLSLERFGSRMKSADGDGNRVFVTSGFTLDWYYADTNPILDLNYEGDSLKKITFHSQDGDERGKQFYLNIAEIKESYWQGN